MNNKNARIVPLAFYEFVHIRLCTKFKDMNMIKRKNIEIMLGRSYNIPKTIQHLIFKELVVLDMVKPVNRDWVTINFTNKEKVNPSQVYSNLGCF